MLDRLNAHYDMIVKAFADGRVVPFLGAGVNLCGLWEGTARLADGGKP
jgi:hypothetical protein